MLKKTNLILRKSYKMRRFLDIFYNFSFFFFLHIDSYSNSNFLLFKKEIVSYGLNIELLSKNEFNLLNKDLRVLSSGYTFLVFYRSGDFAFSQEIENLFLKFGFLKNFLIVKYRDVFLTFKDLKTFYIDYKNSKYNIYTKIISILVNFYTFCCKNIVVDLNLKVILIFRKVFFILRSVLILFLYKLWLHLIN